MKPNYGQTSLAVLFGALVSTSMASADHPGDDSLHFSHPIVIESPSPDTKVNINYSFADLDGDEEKGDEQEVSISGEYAFNRAFSIEVEIPYTFLDLDDEGSESDLNNIEVAFKFANFAFEDKGLLLGYGLELGLPTGDDDKDIGSDHILELEPFFSVGYKVGRTELVGLAAFGIPINQDHEAGEEIETELGFGVSALHHFSDRFAGLLELEGETVLSGDEDGTTVVNVAPGIKVRPFEDRALDIGLSVAFPISDEEEFDFQTKLALFYHF